LGGLGGGLGRKRYKKNIYLSDDELDTLRAIADMGVVIELKMVPGDPPVTL
jgi:mannose/fructose/N-acetylgalactosamine-specific phosphotransferase system component IIB